MTASNGVHNATYIQAISGPLEAVWSVAMTLSV